MNPTCIIKAEQVAKTRERNTALKAAGAAPMADGRSDRAANAVSAAKRAGGRIKKALEVARMEPMECPMKTLLEAARAGDEYAMWQAENVYGKSWRAK